MTSTTHADIQWNLIMGLAIAAYWFTGIAACGFMHMLHEQARRSGRHAKYINDGPLACVLLVVVWPVFAAYVGGMYVCKIINALVGKLEGSSK